MIARLLVVVSVLLAVALAVGFVLKVFLHAF